MRMIKQNLEARQKKNLLESYDNKWDKVERNLKRQKTLGDKKKKKEAKYQ